MYCGTNKTAIQSQRQIASAMMALIREKPYREMADEYLKRLGRYGKYEEAEVPDLPAELKARMFCVPVEAAFLTEAEAAAFETLLLGRLRAAAGDKL